MGSFNILLEPVGQFDSAEPGHHHVADHDIGTFGTDSIEGVLTVYSDRDQVLSRQFILKILSEVRIVLYDQQMLPALSHHLGRGLHILIRSGFLQCRQRNNKGTALSRF